MTRNLFQAAVAFAIAFAAIGFGSPTQAAPPAGGAAAAQATAPSIPNATVPGSMTPNAVSPNAPIPAPNAGARNGAIVVPNATAGNPTTGNATSGNATSGNVTPGMNRLPPQRAIGTDYADRSNGAYQGTDPNLGRMGARLPLRSQNRDGYPIGDPYGRTLPGQGGFPTLSGTQAAGALNGVGDARTRFDVRTTARRTMFGQTGAANASGPTFGTPAFSGIAPPTTASMQNAAFAGFGSAANPIQIQVQGTAAFAPVGANAAVAGLPSGRTLARGTMTTNANSPTMSRNDAAAARTAAAMQLTPENMRAVPGRF